MAAPKKDRGGWMPRPPKGPKPVSYKARPQGEVDYDALCDEVVKTYPKVIERLAE